ncbi:hypothetical protein [Staphylococcus simulans]|uniref:hypothetical protein n=1 Tax=Staphylococcus simulans TaxID=1286 RepID=UPI000D1E976E|nr:hypothetical protein [Staphylococcus simulans]PTJ92080.1 hypothetical protein BU032_03385 [Staphylococcus simulans]
MTKTYPALAFELIGQPGLYIAEGPYNTKDVNEAFLAVKKDGTLPDKFAYKRDLAEQEKIYKEQMEKQFGKGAVVNYKPTEWFEYCELVEVQISEKRFKELLGYE